MSAERPPFSTTTTTMASAEGAAAARFSYENSLVDVDASLRLPVVARLCRERGYLFPLARPLPPFSVAAACSRVPFLVDAYVHSADAVTPEGAPLSTGGAPRSATGPDLLGALCSQPPLATATRVRLRVLDARTARVREERFDDAAAAAARVASWLEEGRAYAVEAFRSDDRFGVRAVGGPAAVDGEPLPRAGLGDPAARPLVDSRSLASGDQHAMRAALTDGARIVAAPFMGRVAALFAVQVTAPSREQGAQALVGALRRAAGGTHG